MSDEKPYIIERQDVPGRWAEVSEVTAPWPRGAIDTWTAAEGLGLQSGRYRVIEKFESFGAHTLEEFEVEVIEQAPTIKVSKVSRPAPEARGPKTGPSVPMSAVPEPGA